MADIRIFKRLQRLFSTDVLIKNSGGNDLRVVDINKIQQSGEIVTNSLISRFRGIYTNSPTSLYGQNLRSNYNYQRTILYSEYDNMDTDAIIASALDIIADESTLKNEQGEVLQIRSTNEDIQRILYNLFYDVINIEFNLWPYIRNTCKYGDFFLKLEIAEKYGVYNVIPFSAFHMERQEGYDSKNPHAIRFKFNVNGVPTSSTNYYQQNENGSENDLFLQNYEVAHFRLLTDTNYMPYGRCLSFDSKIYTNKSIKEIQSIIKGDKVWTFNIEKNKYELANVLAVINNGIKPLWKVFTSNNEIKATSNHPFLVWDLKHEKPVYKQLKDLKKGDYLCTYKKAPIKLKNPKLNNKINSSYNIKLSKIKSIIEELPEETYDIQVDKNSNFISDGIIVHNSYIEPARKLFKQYCLDGDTKIWTPNGYKLIKNIKIGDKVFTYNKKTLNFEISNVKNSAQTGYKKIYKITTPHRSLFLTKSHHILTEGNIYKNLYDLKIGDKIFIGNNIEIIAPKIPIIYNKEDLIYAEVNNLGREYLRNKTTIFCKECSKIVKTFNSGAHLKTHNLNINEYKNKWGQNSTYNITYNKQFQRGDYRIKLLDLKEQLETSGVGFNKFHYNFHYKNQQSKLIEEEILNNNIKQIIRLFGFMLGDGWIDYCNDTFCFSLGNRLDKSLKYYDLLIGLGFSPVIQKAGTKAQVNLSNLQLINIFEELGFKTGTLNKEVPEWVFSLPIDFQKEFLKGFVDADGCYVKTDKTWQVSGINQKLIEDLKYISQRVGFRTTNIHKNSPINKIFNKINYKITTTCYSFRFKEEENKNVLLEKITSIKELDKRPVYDIETESNNHNFIADGVIVHNSLMEDAMLIHRIVRSPEKRIFYIGVGGLAPSDIPGYMEKTINTMKRTPYIDPQTGDYNLKFNLQNSLEDFFIPVRPGDGGTTKIDTAKGLEYTGIDDVVYLRDKLFAALKIPKAFMGYEKDLCISPETKIPLLDGRILTAQEIINEYNENKKNYVYSLDEKTNNIVPGEIEWAGFTRMNTQTIKVWLDNEEFIQCTPDHLFLTRKGEWKEAQNLLEGESLMPLYLQKSKQTKIKVNKIEWIEEKIDTCDLTIKEFHNFGTTSVIIHNSGKATLAAEDIRFARTIERIQRIVISELYKIALIHLYTQGYEGDDLTNFTLSLTTPSIIYDQERIALLKEKVGVAKDMQETKLFSSDKIYLEVFHMSEEEANEERDLVREDAKRKFRVDQIENEGNDPAESGESYGTPHDLASLYGKGRYKSNDVPDGYKEEAEFGRPEEKSSEYGTQDHILGKDPIGKKSAKNDDQVAKRGLPINEIIAKQEYFKHKKLFESMKKIVNVFEEKKENSLLDENQIRE